MSTQDELKVLKEIVAGYDVLKQRISELEEQGEQEQEFPQYNDTYYYISPNGSVDWFKWDKVDYDLEAQRMGNVFRTIEQAEFASEGLRVEAELRKFSISFGEGEENNHITYRWSVNELSISTSFGHQDQGVIYFESKEKAQQAIESVGADRIKKYIFGVEE